jgi:hypothetical protein
MVLCSKGCGIQGWVVALQHSAMIVAMQYNEKWFRISMPDRARACLSSPRLLETAALMWERLTLSPPRVLERFGDEG